VELYMLRPRGTSRAGRAAINAGRLDGIVELAVCRGVAGDDRGPTGVVLRCGWELRVFR
jgi:hypothetical protein